MRARGRTSLLLIAAALALAAVPASALGGPAADADPYALTAVALLGNEGTDVYLTVSSSTADVPDRIDKIQGQGAALRRRPTPDAQLLRSPAPGGVAVLHVGDLARHRPLQLVAHVKDGSQSNVEAATQVLLRPDLTVAQLSAPADVVSPTAAHRHRAARRDRGRQRRNGNGDPPRRR
jgi:hypothetical protein